MLAWSPTAHAQDAASDATSDSDAQDDAADGQDANTPAAAPKPWAKNDAITVVERLPYERAGRYYLTAFVGVVPNDPFVIYAPVGLRVGRYFNESLALDLSLSYLDTLAFDRDLRGRIGRSGEASSAVSLQDHPVGRAQCSAAWSLFAGKMRSPGGRPIHVRGHVLAGFGALLARDAADAIDPRAEGLVGLGFAAQVTDTGTVGLEVRQTLFRRESGGVLTPTELSLAYTHIFGGPLGGAR